MVAHTGNRFQKGSGIYKCRICGKNTRATGHKDNEHVRLCRKCYVKALKEND